MNAESPEYFTDQKRDGVKRVWIVVHGEDYEATERLLWHRRHQVFISG